jgi:aminocarboxymuconate-semialdehyde decarboxylase
MAQALTTDIHNHAIPQAAIELLQRVPDYGVTIDGSRWHGGHHVDFELVREFVDPEAKLAEMRQNGIDRAVVSSAPPLFYYELGPELAIPLCDAVNRGLAGFHRAAPDRFWWMANLPMQVPETAAALLVQTVGSGGCVGVEIGSNIAGRRLDEPEFEPFWAAAEQHAAPVLIHPDTTYSALDSLDRFYFQNIIGLPLETTVTVERLIAAGVFARHPGLRVVLVHGGGFFPYHAGRVRHGAEVRPELAASPPDPWRHLEQLWFDVITHDAQALRYLVDRVGADRVVLGTDLPFDMALRDPIAAIDDAVSRDLRELITTQNPTRLYPAIPLATVPA